MQIREGKYYITHGGHTVGPAEPRPPYHYPIPRNGGFLAYHDDGTFSLGNRNWDIASEVYPLWRDMTPEQKGALLMAHHEGKVIETFYAGKWKVCQPEWVDECAYRVRTEPRRETVVLHGAGYEWTQADLPCEDDTHRITFDLLDGEPDCASIKMEKL